MNARSARVNPRTSAQVANSGMDTPSGGSGIAAEVLKLAVVL